MKFPLLNNDNLPVNRNPVQELVSEFLNRRSANTRRAYQADLDAFADYLGLNSREEALRELIDRNQGQANALVLAYKNFLISKGLTPNTVNRRLSTLRSGIKLANQLGLVNWTINIENEKTETYRDTQGPGRTGFADMLRAVDSCRNKKKAARDKAILRLLYDLALRRGEVAGLDLEDFDSEAGTLAILGKGRTQKQILTLPETAQEALRAWIEARGDIPLGPLFVNLDRAGKGRRLTGTSIYRIVRDIGREVGLDTRPHGIRHLAITEALNITNGNVRMVQRFSRHKNMQTLTAYDDNRQDYAGEIAKMISMIIL
jgi:integrase/recombinase XerC